MLGEPRGGPLARQGGKIQADCSEQQHLGWALKLALELGLFQLDPPALQEAHYVPGTHWPIEIRGDSWLGS